MAYAGMDRGNGDECGDRRDFRQTQKADAIELRFLAFDHRPQLRDAARAGKCSMEGIVSAREVFGIAGVGTLQLDGGTGGHYEIASNAVDGQMPDDGHFQGFAQKRRPDLEIVHRA